MFKKMLKEAEDERKLYDTLLRSFLTALVSADKYGDKKQILDEIEELQKNRENSEIVNNKLYHEIGKIKGVMIGGVAAISGFCIGQLINKNIK